MGYVDFDPETGESVLIPDPTMDGPGDQLPGLPGLPGTDGQDLPGLPGLDLPGQDGQPGGGSVFDQISHTMNDTVPGGDSETPPELWLAGPQWTGDEPAEDTSHHGFD